MLEQAESDYLHMVSYNEVIDFISLGDYKDLRYVRITDESIFGKNYVTIDLEGRVSYHLRKRK